MPNFFDDANSGEEEFKDQPEEMDGKYVPDGQGGQVWVPGEAPAPQVTVTKPATPPPAARKPAPQVEEVEEEAETEEEGPLMDDALFRLEQGRLFKMILKHDLFEGVDADARAIEAVQKLIRDYAQERMEIMLGMRQEPSQAPTNAFPMESFPFNSVEVQALKDIVKTLTKGASEDAEPFVPTEAPPARTTLKPIGGGAPRKATPAPVAPKPKAPAKPLQSKAQAPVKRSSATVEQILREEGITLEEYNAIMDGTDLTRAEMAKMTEDDIIARNNRIRNQRAKAQVTTPMPTYEQQVAHYTQRSESAASNTKGWKELIEGVKAMPPTLVNNQGEQ